MIVFIELITFLIIYIYNKFFINYCINLLEVRNKLILKIYPILMSIISIILIWGKTYTPIAYIIMFFVQMIIFKIIFSDSIGVIYNVVIYQIFHMIVNRDIVIGILSIILKKSMYQVVQSHEAYIISFALCRILVLILGFNFEKICSLDIAKKLLINRKRLKSVNLTVTSLVIILLNSNYIYYYYSGDISTTTFYMLANLICINTCFYFALSMGIKSIKWVEDEVLYKSNLLNLEYNENINKKIDDYSNLLKMYNHDFKNILLNIKDAIEIGDNEKAKEIILAFDEKIKCVTNYNKKLSNNSLINALLNRLYEECNSKSISFNSDCYIPSNISITDLELVNIFNNLSSNAFEACIKQDNTESKWINFKSYVKDDNLIIYQNNSFNGYIKFTNDRLITTKKNKKIHGIGVESIKHIVNKVNGMAIIKVDEEKREFKFLIKIPLLKT
ncbi:TPA: sensor histidine kinase [Clostridium perfringens]|nr:sensor histidine kinase [Clostridium perfringens]